MFIAKAAPRGPTTKGHAVFNLNRGSNPNNPIGELGSVDGWKSLPIQECGEPLVPLGSFSNYWRIATDSIYFGERGSSPYPTAKLEGSTIIPFVREGVAKRLGHANSLLPAGYMLLVWDAWRSLKVQKALFDYYVDVLERKGSSHDDAVIAAQKFVSIPSEDPTKPPPHNTGAAVDLTIIRFPRKDWREMERLTAIVEQPENRHTWRAIFEAEMRRIKLIRERGVPLEMGTVFDGVAPQTATRFYENKFLLSLRERRIRRNRRLLWSVMTAAGFSNYPEEWWHYDFGNQFDTARTGRPAIYGTAVFTAENQRREDIRLGHYHQSVGIAEDRALVITGKLGMHGYFPFVRSIVMQTGNLSVTNHPRAAAI